jgi:hypothetical protein
LREFGRKKILSLELGVLSLGFGVGGDTECTEKAQRNRRKIEIKRRDAKTLRNNMRRKIGTKVFEVKVEIEVKTFKF